MRTQIEKILNKIEPLRQEIIHHKIYSSIQNLEDLRIFMQYHIYAVWDFMSLLKTLQNNLTCTTVPWFPVGTGDNRYLINEIVVGEESDLDSEGIRKSHYEIYLNAMNQSGANTTQIQQFIEVLKKTNNLIMALNEADSPMEVKDFILFTFKIIETKKPYLQASLFTFGREDLIPNMFTTIVNDISKNVPSSTSIFKFYLERHIEIDGNHHKHLAYQMLYNLCEESEEKWQEAEDIAYESLKMRLRLWEGAYQNILQKKAIFS